MHNLGFERNELVKIRDCIREHGPISREGIIQKTGCRPEVVDMVLRLTLEMKLISQSSATPEEQSQPLYALIIREYSTYRFNLPEDLVLVKIRAYADALVFAFNNTRFNKAPDSDPIEEAHFIANEYWKIALSWSPSSRVKEFVPVEGVGSTNNLVLFQEIYIDAFVKYYPNVLDRLQSGQIFINPTLSEEDRELMFYHLAEQAIAAES